MIKKSEPESEPKDVEIELLGDVIFRFGKNVPFLRIPANEMPGWATRMAQEFLSEATEVLYEGKGCPVNNLDGLRDYLIQILEEKFELAIKTCWNCKNFHKDSNVFGPTGNKGWCYRFIRGLVIEVSMDMNNNECWVPKEIPEEDKKKEKNCTDCVNYAVDTFCKKCREKDLWNAS